MVGSNTTISSNSLINATTLGPDSYLGTGVSIQANCVLGTVTIMDNVQVKNDSTFGSGGNSGLRVHTDPNLKPSPLFVNILLICLSWFLQDIN